MKNYWLEARIRKTIPSFKFELIGIFPPCNVHIIKGGITSLVVTSDDSKFIAFSKQQSSPKGTDGFIQVFLNGKIIEVWSLLDVTVNGWGQSYNSYGEEKGSIVFTCANFGLIKSKHFKL